MAESTSRNHLLRHPPDEPREAADAPLAGQVVLLPRVKEPDRIASALERAGAEVQRAAVTRTVPGETAALEATARRIVAGEAAWLVLTSARTVEALAPYLHVPVPSALQVAVVGPATARAWTELTGAAPDLVSRGSAAALLEEPVLVGPPPAPSAAKRVLLPASALADPALADGLRRAGWEVEQVSAYTTVTAGACDLPPGLDDSWAASGVDAVVLTAPSSTRAVLELLGPPPSTTRLVTIGATTAAAARELGLPVAAIAPSPRPRAFFGPSSPP
ncbi:uroporphyrinogen-III synthase [Actinomyces naeslundii]|uniref:Uroporphyrinogen-III synthase n=1 Tax=Actinomyces naeslundii (strain ATCC 12104 / DSM 43013 / CCUG 2238 / JCM 8349 / NCTC 10301 / Howell 279) TaxID=1115803 RepID=J3A830_ACTNH|nr:uroporphyrinogen-III synthase [Actinomyces naeslundii]EJN83553.1 uroporphyrinogen-III synthase [Actinomyces naeslundii str. Howell 279]